MRRPTTAASVIAAALLLAACAPGGAMTDPTSSSARPPFHTTTPGAIAPTGTPTDVPAARWDAIVADLASRGVAGSPVLVSAESITFNDGSLGCASPGQSYTQARIDGMRVVVTADGDTYDYRFGKGDAPKLCTR